MKPWTEYLREDEQALLGTDPVVDRVLERLAYERFGVEMMTPAYLKSLRPVWETMRPTGAELADAVQTYEKIEASAGGRRSQECRDRAAGHLWEGPHPADPGHRWPYLKCSHCRCTSAAHQHALPA